MRVTAFHLSLRWRGGRGERPPSVRDDRGHPGRDDHGGLGGHREAQRGIYAPQRHDDDRAAQPGADSLLAGCGETLDMVN